MSKLNKSIVADFESAQITRELPKFSQGDTVVVNVKVKEGNRERVQAYEGVVIGTKNAGLNSSFTVRKISHGYGVERVFQTHSSIIDSVEVKRRGKVRSGNHAAIARWRRQQSLLRTALRRPDLLEEARLGKADRRLLDEARQALAGEGDAPTGAGGGA